MATRRTSLSLLLSAIPLLSGAVVQAESRPPISAFQAATPLAPPSSAHPAWGGSVASLEEKRGVPSLLFVPRARSTSASPEDAAREHLLHHAPQYGVGGEHVRAAETVRVLDTGRGGILVVLRQRVDGIPLFEHEVKVLMDRELSLVAIGGSLHPSALPSPKHGSFLLQKEAALAMALGDLYDAPASPFDLVVSGPLPDDYASLTLAPTAAAAALGIELSSARAKRVYYVLPDRLQAAYYVEIASRRAGSRTSDAHAYVISATDGQILHRLDLTHAAKNSYRVWADEKGDLRPHDGPLADTTPYPAGGPDGKYPGTVAPPLIAIDGFNGPHDPWLPDGAVETTGNNVDAYTDDDKPDGFSPGDLRAHVSSPGTFDYLYDFEKGPQASSPQRMAAVTSLFYTTNWLHDWWYDSGFDEAGKNAQTDDYGRGGVGGDPLLAQAQNGAPLERNNSDMSVFADGMSPRMQMFVWDGKITASLGEVGAAPDTAVGVAGFGPTSFDVTGTAVLAADATDPIHDICEDLTTDVAGKIAVVERGLCPFEQKALRAQQAGALGIVIIDNKPGERAPAMGKDPNTTDVVTIPILSVTMDDGTALEDELSKKAVTLRMQRAEAPDLDGTIDNTVVAHEWGHYLHLRHVSCGSSMCAAESEGWADFTALQMVVRAGDNLHGAYPLGQYATGAFLDDPAYFGIRRYPYSVDATKNPLTFRHITSGEPLPTTAPIALDAAQSGNSEVHAAGEVWAAMLFGGFVALLERSQGPSPAYTFDEARRRMADYVVMGMSLAPESPTYTEQRDALLAAASTRDPLDVAALAAAFARRGAGTCARSPARDSIAFVGVVESFQVEPSATLESIRVDDSVTSCDQDGHLDAGETGNVTVILRNDAITPLDGASATVRTTTAGVTFPSGAKLLFPTIAPFATAEASVDVTLDPTSPPRERLDLTVSVDSVICGGTVSLSALPLANYDDAATGATTDTVEAAGTTWMLAGDGSSFIWSRVEPTPGNKVWSGVDYPAPTDTQLVSPPLTVGAHGPLVLTFSHRFQFESSMGTNFDGGVIEVSTDAGATWQDIGVYGDPMYPGMIGDPTGQAKNALAGRAGFVDHNSSYPAMDTVTVSLGASLSGKTIQVRFRIGTDDAGGAFGWELDDIGFSGIDDAPFAAVIDNVMACPGVGGEGGAAGSGGAGGGGLVDPESATAPVEELSGGSCGVAGGPPGAPPLLLVVGAAAWATRRRRRPSLG